VMVNAQSQQLHIVNYRFLGLNRGVFNGVFSLFIGWRHSGLGCKPLFSWVFP
jgi:hypothetical protein